MTTADAALVRRKLRVIARDVRALAAIARTPLDAYLGDFLLRKATERLLQEAVEACIDINTHVARASRQGPPEDNHAGFELLARLGVLPRALADEVKPAAGLRNIIVHEYETLDDAVVLESAADAARLLPRYVAAVEQYLSRDETHR